MKAIDIPTKFNIPFADSAGPGYIESIPQAASPTPGKASLETGFPPPNFTPTAAGGIPPWGADMNGLQNQITSWIRWQTAGGIPVIYDAAFSTAIGGYPQGAMLRAATIGNGLYWISTVDDNTSNPDASGANWIAFPDLDVQLQRPNYAVDAGAVNAAAITLAPVPTSFAQLVGAPIRFKIGFTNTVTNPTVKINALTAATMINGDGSAIAIGQLVAGRVVEGIPCDDGKFQITSPAKPVAATSQFVTGAIYGWANETAPAGTLECAGQLLNIADQPNLYAKLGTRFGGDGVTTFRNIDLRGEFLRGWDHGRGLDPNAATRTNAGGGATGDHVGTNQAGQVGPFTASGTTGVNFPGDMGGGFVAGPQGEPGPTPGPLPGGLTNQYPTTITNATSENRPVNIYVMYIIGL